MTDQIEPWEGHAACDQRITDDGTRIAELEAEIGRIRDILLRAGMPASIEGHTRATWHLVEEAAAMWREYPTITSESAEAMYEVERLRDALVIVRDVLDARPSEGLSFASALGLRSIVDHALSAGEPM